MSHPSTKEHTPGTWWVLPSNPLIVESKSHGNICLVNLARASEADARLISAAPDMYEALRFVRRLWAKDDSCEEIRVIERALAKAEGR